jgi:hypothetical protein
MKISQYQIKIDTEIFFYFYSEELLTKNAISSLNSYLRPLHIDRTKILL